MSLLFENINFLLRQKGASPLSAEAFFKLDPEVFWDLLSQLDAPYELIAKTDLQQRDEAIRAKRIELLVLDVDGVLTDGGLYYSSEGEEIKKFNVKDGMAITEALRLGLKVGIISAASRSEVVEHRARLLGIEHCYVGKRPKEEVLEEWLYTFGLSFDQVAYIGDDINDCGILAKCGLGAAPADAVQQAREAAALRLRAKGGEGCVRELWDVYLRRHYQAEH